MKATTTSRPGAWRLWVPLVFSLLLVLATAPILAHPPAPADTTLQAGSYFSGPTVTDIHNDGLQDIILTNQLLNQVEVYDGEGYFVWLQPTDGAIKGGATTADLDGDDLPEIIVGDATGNVYVWDFIGNLLDGWPATAGDGEYRIISTPATGDVDGDGNIEIVVTVSDGNLYVFGATGIPEGDPLEIGNIAEQFGDQDINSSPTIADVDEDGSLEIVVGSYDNRLYLFNLQGAYDNQDSAVPRESVWSFRTNGVIRSTPVVADIDPDTEGNEIVFGSGDSKLYVLNKDGGLLWEDNTNWTISSSPAVGDIDGDGQMEIVIGNDREKVYAWNHDGSTLDTWPKDVEGNVFAAPAIGDLGDDGRLEVVAATDKGRVYAWDSNGVLLNGWPKTMTQAIMGAPVIADLTGDNEAEVVAADTGGDFKFFTWSGESVEPDPAPTPTPTIDPEAPTPTPAPETDETVFIPIVNR